MKSIISSLILLLLVLCSCSENRPVKRCSLKDALENKFLIGVAVNNKQCDGRDSVGDSLIRAEFNSVVAENCMKSEVIHPEKDRYDFTRSDRFVEYAEKNRMYVIGHTLVWHSQLSPWFACDEKGQDVSRDELIERMRDHIYNVVGRYKGRIQGWDVVNEAFEDNGEYRHTKFYDIIGKEYIPLAFRFAHEADPEAELYYNDYSMAKPEKRNAVVALVNELKAQGIRIDGVGMQGHLLIDYPALDEYENSIIAFAGTGMKVHITELDMTMLPWPDSKASAEVSLSYEYTSKMNPYPESLPAVESKMWNDRMADFFRLFIKHSDKIKRVTLWGVTDGDSWRNDWPIEGRTDYPLLFDRNHQPKAAVDSILKEAAII